LKTDAIVHHQPSHCLNCGAAVQASYCQHCGQETAAHVPSAGEFLHEFIGHYVALESKLWKTLALLLFKPGRLTCEYIEGKRVRYVQPLRLYLTLSVVFFALVKFGAHEVHLRPPEAPPAVEAARPPPQASSAEADQAAGDGKQGITKTYTAFDNNVDDLNTWVKSISPKAEAKLRKFRALAPEQQEREIKAGLFGYLPYAIFAMMPVFALYLKLMYLGSGRLYGEHLLFALHTNAFAFLMLILMVLLPSHIPYLSPALGLWLAFYLPTAMRKVYGGSRLATGLRWVALMSLHIVGMFAAMVGVVVLGVIA
jgi:hypothetical protein